jgi:6-phosphofructokinase
MGADCGYLAVMSALASGAERAYINEEGVTLKDLQDDLQMLENRFHRDHKYAEKLLSVVVMSIFLDWAL